MVKRYYRYLFIHTSIYPTDEYVILRIFISLVKV